MALFVGKRAGTVQSQAIWRKRAGSPLLFVAQHCANWSHPMTLSAFWPWVRWSLALRFRRLPATGSGPAPVSSHRVKPPLPTLQRPGRYLGHKKSDGRSSARPRRGRTRHRLPLRRPRLRQCRLWQCRLRQCSPRRRVRPVAGTPGPPDQRSSPRRSRHPSPWAASEWASHSSSAMRLPSAMSQRSLTRIVLDGATTMTAVRDMAKSSCRCPFMCRWRCTQTLAAMTLWTTRR